MYIAVSLNKHTWREKENKQKKSKKKKRFYWCFQFERAFSKVVLSISGLYVYKSVYTLVISPLFPPRHRGASS